MSRKNSREETQKSILTLPDEMLIHIFQFLDHDDFKRASLSCKMFCKISRDPCLWQNQMPIYRTKTIEVGLRQVHAFLTFSRGTKILILSSHKDTSTVKDYQKPNGFRTEVVNLEDRSRGVYLDVTHETHLPSVFRYDLEINENERLFAVIQYSFVLCQGFCKIYSYNENKIGFVEAFHKSTNRISKVWFNNEEVFITDCSHNRADSVLSLFNVTEKTINNLFRFRHKDVLKILIGKNQVTQSFVIFVGRNDRTVLRLITPENLSTRNLDESLNPDRQMYIYKIKNAELINDDREMICFSGITTFMIIDIDTFTPKIKTFISDSWNFVDGYEFIFQNYVIVATQTRDRYFLYCPQFYGVRVMDADFGFRSHWNSHLPSNLFTQGDRSKISVYVSRNVINEGRQLLNLDIVD